MAMYKVRDFVQACLPPPSIARSPSAACPEATREDGSLAGEGTYLVAADGTTMVATTRGFDSQLRPFTMKTVWDRR